MTSRICLDTGPITLHFTKDEPKEISILMNDIKQQKTEAYVILPILVEVFKHLCIAKGKLFAESSISSLQKNYPLILVSLSNDIILKAGGLKCQYRRILSYFDCLVIAYALNERLVLHTTEKDLPSIQNLRVKKYQY
ncbi:MAG: PIN domain-containing protein [Candidatus Hodarchaeales archaeon]|jgi:predicted nucleic acid-binding protein